MTESSPDFSTTGAVRPRFTGKVEWAETFQPRPDVRHVLFDFDGTLSLIREGWPDVMIPMFMEMLPRHVKETDEQIRKLLFEDIMRLNGKQTIYQMIQFADRVCERGGQAREPLWYKHEYIKRLEVRIQDRVEGLQMGIIQRESLLVHGVIEILENLQERGMNLYLASGTDEAYVKREAALLGVESYFNSHIYGALDNYKNFSKKMIIERILQENDVTGGALLGFGDGYVEIQNTVEAGGFAVGVASDEANNGSGDFDEWKRKRLLGVGAHGIIPDFRDADPLLKVILGE